ncbi:MAG TPA: hypothetical protein VLB51_07250 [Methylomirabilota bacterium]|nr:hypothetical protein [Methylomirabilota bacterium]
MKIHDSQHWQDLSVECLRFFGAMSASVSHEIRNKLAVINEKAGLVEDIAAAMRSGRAPDPDRLETQARKIVDQVQQANRIVRALNRLAHSTDESDATVDVADLAALVVELYGRKAAMAQAVVRSEGPDGGVPVHTNPYLLANAIGLCLGAAVARVDDSRALTVVTENAANGAAVRFGRLAGGGVGRSELEGECPGLGTLLETLDAGLAMDAEGGELVLEVRSLKSDDPGGHQ